MQCFPDMSKPAKGCLAPLEPVIFFSSLFSPTPPYLIAFGPQGGLIDDKLNALSPYMMPRCLKGSAFEI